MGVYEDKVRGTWYYSGKYKDIYGNWKTYMKRGFQLKRIAATEERNFLLSLKQKRSVYEYKFEDVVTMFLDYKSTRIKPRSLYDIKHLIGKRITPYFEGMYIDQINFPIIEQYQNELLSLGFKNSYLDSIQSMLSQIFKFAVRKMIIELNPMEYLDYVRNTNEKKTGINFFTYEQFTNFLSCVEDKYKIIFKLLYFTGMRISEVQTRTWGDIDWNNGTLSINSNYDTKTKGITHSTKNGSIRTIYLNKSLLESLKTHYESKKNIYEFNNNRFILGFDRVLPQKTVENQKEYAIKKWNEENPDDPIPRIRIHDFRHSHVSLLINNEVDSFTIAERLGHSKEMVEKRYGHMFPEKRRKILNVLDNL